MMLLAACLAPGPAAGARAKGEAPTVVATHLRTLEREGAVRFGAALAVGELSGVPPADLVVRSADYNREGPQVTGWPDAWTEPAWAISAHDHGGTSRFGEALATSWMYPDDVQQVFVGDPAHGDDVSADAGRILGFDLSAEPVVTLDRTGGAAGDAFGASLTGGVDVNGDARPEIAAGYPMGSTDPKARAHDGGARLYYGVDKLAGDSPMDGLKGASLPAGVRAGTGVALAERCHDGGGAVVLGAPGDGKSGPSGLYLYRPTKAGDRISAEHDLRLVRAEPGLGAAVVTTPDLEGDGFEGLLFAPWAFDEGTGSVREGVGYIPDCAGVGDYADLTLPTEVFEGVDLPGAESLVAAPVTSEQPRLDALFFVGVPGGTTSKGATGAVWMVPYADGSFGAVALEGTVPGGGFGRTLAWLGEVPDEGLGVLAVGAPDEATDGGTGRVYLYAVSVEGDPDPDPDTGTDPAETDACAEGSTAAACLPPPWFCGTGGARGAIPSLLALLVASRRRSPPPSGTQRAGSTTGGAHVRRGRNLPSTRRP